MRKVEISLGRRCGGWKREYKGGSGWRRDYIKERVGGEGSKKEGRDEEGIVN